MKNANKKPNKAVSAVFILRIIAITLLCCVIALSTVTVVLTKLGLRRTSKWFPGAFVTIESGSMEPLLHTGDLIFVWGTSFSELQVGDVITIYTGNEFVTHGVSRIEDESVITKGLANEQEDAPIDEREYVAKMIFSIHGGAFAWELLSSPGFTVLLILLFALLIFGVPLCKWIYKLVQKKGNTLKIRVGVLRFVSFVAIVSLLLTSPYLSSAKYKAQVDDQFPTEAKSIYFKSNYLSDGEGSYSQIQGWNGKTYEFHLTFMNFDNELLFNQLGTDLDYQIRVDNVQVSTDTILHNFEFVLEEKADNGNKNIVTNATSPDLQSGFYGIYHPTEINGGAANSAELYLTLRSTMFTDGAEHTEANRQALSAGESISFTVTAWTENENYSQILSARYDIHVTDDKAFISDITAPQKAGTAVFNVNMKSNQVPGISSRRIRYVWNPALIYLNEYDATAMYLKNTGVFNKEEGWLEINVQPLSSISLQFFKRKVSMNITVSASYKPSENGTMSYDEIVITPTDNSGS